MKLLNYFQRVVLINLKRRPDRLADALHALDGCQWPFQPPQIFEAVDGMFAQPPPKWLDSAGAWGCLQSHHRILSSALADGIQSVLVLEDDICFAGNFRTGVEAFLREVPDDWEQLMLGGQHMNHTGQPSLVKPGVVRCTDCERTHCYAIRGEFMRRLAERWLGGGKFDGTRHCDWIMGRDPEMQLAHRVYAPEFFLVGQDRRSVSDVFGVGLPRNFWNPPTPDMSVIFLQAPATVVSQLRHHGFCTGDGLHRKGDLGLQLMRLFERTAPDSSQRVRMLGDWIKIMQWELAAESALRCTVWHPQATLELVREASLWPVYPIIATSVAEAIRQLPAHLRWMHKSPLPAVKQFKWRPLAERDTPRAATTKPPRS